MKERSVPVLYLDLDGTVRWGLDELGRFVNGPDDVHVFDEVPELLTAYKAEGWRIIGVSNQGGIALGHVREEDVQAALIETQRQCREAFDKIAYCKHHPDADDPEMARCWCRKPRAGLLIDAALALAQDTRERSRLLMSRAKSAEEQEAVAKVAPPEIYPPHLALMVGDRDEDRGCADAANVRFMDAREWRAGGHKIG